MANRKAKAAKAARFGTDEAAMAKMVAESRKRSLAKAAELGIPEDEAIAIIEATEGETQNAIDRELAAMDQVSGWAMERIDIADVFGAGFAPMDAMAFVTALASAMADGIFASTDDPDPARAFNALSAEIIGGMKTAAWASNVAVSAARLGFLYGAKYAVDRTGVDLAKIKADVQA